MMIGFMIVGVVAQAAFAVLLIGACLAVAGTVAWAICNA